MGKSNRISKKLLSVVLCVLLLICVPMTVFADGNTENVSAVYEAFILVQNALESGSFESLKDAVDGFYEVTDIFNELDEDELEELAVLLEVEDEEAVYSLILSDWIDANVVVSVGEVYNAYVQNPNGKTAADFIEMMDSYDETYADRTLIEHFFLDIADVYAAALADMPSEDVLTVYEAFILVQNALESGWFEELEVAVDGFYDVIDTFNDLNEEALEELAVLLEAEDGETVYSLILSDWIDANVVVSVGEVYNAYAEDPNKETATALIEMMDSYDEMYEGDRSLIESFFMGITDVYADAEALVADEENNTENNNTENNNTENNDTQNNNTQNNNVQDNSTGKSTDKTAGSTETKTVAALKTGDDSNVWMYLLVVVCGGMICGIIAKERKRRAVK